METVLIYLIPTAVTFYVIFIYNKIIQRKNAVKMAEGALDAMLKKRHDLLPNLVQLTRDHAITESNILKELFESNAANANIGSLQNNASEILALSSIVNKSLSRLISFPAFVTNSSFLKLQAAWNECEEQIAAARRFYNTAVMEYNNTIESFPANLLVDPKKFMPLILPELTAEERQSPSVKEMFRNQ